MKIGLIDVDGHASKKKWGATIYPNLALCKISSYHKMNGDHVEWYDGLFGGEYDIVYMAKVFSFSKDYMGFVNAKKIVKGGTGYDVHSELPNEIDDCQPDYTIYPNVPMDVSYGFLTRGCPNKCPWCVVPEKEGKIRPYWDVDKVANGRKKIVLMDNNLLAAGDYAHEQLDKIIANGYHIDLNQANDARLVTDEFARQFARVKWIHGRIRFGCDTTAQIKYCEEAMEKINSYGFRGEYFLYTMIGGVTYLMSATIEYDSGGRSSWIGGERKGGGLYTHMRSHIVTRIRRIKPYRCGRRIWQAGATSECISFPAISRTSSRGRDSDVMSISKFQHKY